MHTTYILKRYVLVTLLTMVALVFAIIFFRLIFGYNTSSILGLFGAVVPAFDAGCTYGRRLAKRPANAYAWKLSVGLVLLNFLTWLVSNLIYMFLIGSFHVQLGMLAHVNAASVFIQLAILLLIYLAITRFFFGLGAKVTARSTQIKNGPS